MENSKRKFIVKEENKQSISQKIMHQKVKIEYIQRQNQKQILETLVRQNINQQFTTRLITAFLEMDGSSEQKIKRIFNRLQKYFLRDPHAKINIKDGYFCKKRQPFYKLKDVYLLENQIILFGIDFVKHSEIIKAYQPQDFCPIDMSHVKLIFNDHNQAIEALMRNKRQEVQQNQIKLENCAINIPKGWLQMKPYYISNYERKILARFATSQQLQITNSKKLSSNIAQAAKKVYDLRKKQAQQIEQRYQQKEKRIRQKIKRIKKRRNVKEETHLELQQMQQIMSDRSFILQNNPDNDQMFMDMAKRLESMKIQETTMNKKIYNQQYLSMVSQSLDQSQNQRQQINNDSFGKRRWVYAQYNQIYQMEQQKRKKEQKQIVIVIDQ